MVSSAQEVSEATAAQNNANHQGGRKMLAKVVGASAVGTTLDWYDYFIYGAAASLVFPKLFFPNDDPLTGVLLSLMTYSVAFLTRPLGAAVFGHFGDKYGRRNTMIYSLVIMGVATTLIGCIPSHATIGIYAPIILVVLRFIQGVGLGGEWGGASLMVTEFTKGHDRGFLGSLVQIASPVGLLLANAVFSVVTFLVSEDAFFTWGWRVPFWSSAILVLVGLWLRFQISETPVFKDAMKKGEVKGAPFSEVFRNHWKKILLAIGARAGSDNIFYLSNVFILVYGTTVLNLDKQILLAAVVCGGIAQAVAIPVLGRWADSWGRRPVLIGGAVAGIILSFAYFFLVGSEFLPLVFLAPILGNLCIAAMWGPLASFVPELFPTHVRYTGAGIGFQSAGIFGGALVPIATTELLRIFNNAWQPVAIYLTISLLILIFCVFIAKETNRIDMREVQ